MKKHKNLTGRSARPMGFICKCGVKTKNIRVAKNESGHLIGNHMELVCRVCRRKQDEKVWRWFRFWQIIGLY